MDGVGARAAHGAWAGLYDAIPVMPNSFYNSPGQITYSVVTADAVLNAGVASSFAFVTDDFSGVETDFAAKVGATTFYDSSNLGAGVIGWEYGAGHVLSFSTCMGTHELSDANYGQLVRNAFNWVPEPTTVVCLVALVAMRRPIGGGRGSRRREECKGRATVFCILGLLGRTVGVLRRGCGGGVASSLTWPACMADALLRRVCLRGGGKAKAGWAAARIWCVVGDIGGEARSLRSWRRTAVHSLRLRLGQSRVERAPRAVGDFGRVKAPRTCGRCALRATRPPFLTRCSWRLFRCFPSLSPASGRD